MPGGTHTHIQCICNAYIYTHITQYIICINVITLHILNTLSTPLRLVRSNMVRTVRLSQDTARIHTHTTKHTQTFGQTNIQVYAHICMHVRT